MSSHYVPSTKVPALVYATIAPAASSELPAQVGQCIESRVAGITTDFPGAPGGGSVIHYENGSQQLSFDKSPEIESSASGSYANCKTGPLEKSMPPNVF